MNPRGGWWPGQWSLRTKLLITALIPLLLLIPVVVALLWSAGQSAYNKVLTSRIRSDLTLAQQMFSGYQNEKYQTLLSWSEGARLAELIVSSKGKVPQEELTRIASIQHFDFVRSVALDGAVDVSSPITLAYQIPSAELQQLRTKVSGRFLSVLSEVEMHQISPELAKRAEITILPTENSSPDDRVVETRGLFLLYHVPLFYQGKLVAVVQAGQLLNKDLDMVDRIDSLVYNESDLLDGASGSATFFLEDVRVATTVKTSNEARAVGTRVSDEVKEAVLGRGEIWLERAFVVNSWFMAGYAPLLDANGARIGMIYVGFLEKPYQNLKTTLASLFIGAVLLAMLVGAVLVNRLVGGIFYPLRRMNFIMNQQEQGMHAARVGPLGRSDEFAALAEHLDDLLDQLQQRTTDLIQLNERLDQRVKDRTADLHAANQKLQEAIEQILASEKLAVMGQLTAGLAHEFNNPLGVMMGHIDLMRIGQVDASALANLKVLDEQVHRMRHIVQKLLQFARPAEFASYTEAFRVRDVVQDSLMFVKAELQHSGAQVKLKLEDTVEVKMSRIELQQILVNLLINATHALSVQNDEPDSKSESVSVSNRSINQDTWDSFILIETSDILMADGSPAVRMSVGNNGPAIARDQQALIFKMFYTTKSTNQGTGLGLPVSRMLIQRYGGDLQVRSPWRIKETHAQAHSGACFDITIPCNPSHSSDLLTAMERPSTSYSTS